MIEVGKTYYFVPHPYYHYVGTVEAIEGPDRYRLRDCVRVHTDNQQDFTAFFANGFQISTIFTRWPDGATLTGPFIVEAPFAHKVPEVK